MIHPVSYDQRELERLEHAPRYLPMITNLLGFSIKIVDAHSFLFMVREIVQLAVYCFETKSLAPYIIDGGSNIGLSVIYLKELYPDAEVLAFEPDTTIVEVLRE